MGKTRTIDRDHVLDMAEQIVGEQGAAALSIDALAKAAGISKGVCSHVSAIVMD